MACPELFVTTEFDCTLIQMKISFVFITLEHGYGSLRLVVCYSSQGKHNIIFFITTSLSQEVPEIYKMCPSVLILYKKFEQAIYEYLKIKYNQNIQSKSDTKKQL